jgi:hypothetical protein
MNKAKQTSRRNWLRTQGVGAAALTAFASGSRVLGSESFEASSPSESEAESASAPTGIDFHDPATNVKLFGRLDGDLSGRIVYSFSTGSVFGLVPGQGLAPDDYGKHLFDFDGCGVKISRLRADGSVEQKSRGWLLYKDPETGVYLDDFVNPYTKEKVAVPPFRAGISGSVMTKDGPQVSASFPMESTIYGKPMRLRWRFMGDFAVATRSAFTRWKERQTGSLRTEMTIDTYVMKASDLANEALTHIPNTYAWTSETQWLSMLKMGDRPGHNLWRSNGVKVFSMDGLPKEFIAATEKKQPGILTDPLKFDA